MVKKTVKPITCPYCEEPFRGRSHDGYLCVKCLIKFEPRHVQ
ncbi:MAG TPA: hypothetical protein VJK52_02380 [Candidatus Nanoarchaeia archaeon]|nr:hypothetical protein [Candidatus Nanoarchaeia archaeon]